MSTSKSSTDSVRVAVGEVTAPHGVRGEVRVYPLTDFPERFAERKEIGVELPDGEIEVLAIDGCRMHRGLVILALAGIEDRKAAERLRGAKLSVGREEMAPLPEGEYYVVDLIGCEVWSTAGERLGELEEVLQTGANDVYVVRRERVQGEETDSGKRRAPLLIPALRKVVREVDLRRARIVIDRLPGLLE